MKKTFVFILLAVLTFAITGLYHVTQQSDIYYHRGRRFFSRGKYQESIPLFEKALEIAPSNRSAVKDIGYAYLWTEQTGQAIYYLEKAADENPEDKKTLFYLAKAYSWDGKYDKAVMTMRGLIRGSPSVDLIKQLAEIYIWNGDLEKAKKILSILAAHYPSDPDVLMLLGKTLYYSGESQEASQILERLMEVIDEA